MSHIKKLFGDTRRVLVHRLTAKTNTVIYKVNRRELYCAVELPLSDYKLYGKQLAISLLSKQLPFLDILWIILCSCNCL